ncbi:fumarylacetoacetate hydrolase family protein [Rhizobium sp. EC-SD404]|uniref:fumarylacetoacetate hydrolase family protein n=1 Tax=Rhizobium sp. EC-SD404 TaxID=2038389 RepID=UPI00125B433C|nr:fumarylacetoacetate hydrolase family protein [Rhizobium sp. EC-SD404]VVT16669.1 Fumarylpyruvate hydrolase [Rhizobium sp. EC-SD404]
MGHEGFVIERPKAASLPVVGKDERFPVRRIYCVGRNYVAHVEEMGGSADRDPPIFFQKPTDSIVESGSTIAYATMTKDFHYELELVMALKSGGYNIPEDKALDHVYGYGVGIDMTRRDIQGGGRPWEIAKSFDESCPCGPITPVEQSGHIEKGNIKLTVNGEARQDSDVSLLIWSLPEIISKLSEFYELKAGDIILTGTPHGVGPVKTGDELVGTIDGLEPLTVKIGDPAK